MRRYPSLLRHILLKMVGFWWSSRKTCPRSSHHDSPMCFSWIQNIIELHQRNRQPTRCVIRLIVCPSLTILFVRLLILEEMRAGAKWLLCRPMPLCSFHLHWPRFRPGSILVYHVAYNVLLIPSISDANTRYHFVQKVHYSDFFHVFKIKVF